VAPQGAEKKRTIKMYAVIKTGGKQYRVAADDVITIEKLEAAPGGTVEFKDVLMLGGAEPKVGAPLVAGARVTAEVLEQGRGPKLIHFHKRRRKNSRRKIGHRQDQTTVRIMEILASGQNPSKKPTGIGVIPLSQRGRKFEALSAPEGGKADDLSLIDGVGPKMLQKLNGAGVYHFWQLAALTNNEAAALERKVDFDNRLMREEWVAQAKELLAGKPPRAKSDRERADKQ
jgi:large subunit ribosomal protein L21